MEISQVSYEHIFLNPVLEIMAAKLRGSSEFSGPSRPNVSMDGIVLSQIKIAKGECNLNSFQDCQQ